MKDMQPLDGTEALDGVENAAISINEGDEPEGVSRSEQKWEEYMKALDDELERAKKDSSMALLKTWIAYVNHRARLKDADKVVGSKMSKIEEDVVSLMQDMELDKWTSQGRTISTRKEIWAGHNDEQKDLLLQALKGSGLDEYVAENYNVQSLSAYVREFDPDRNLTHEQLLAKLPEGIRPYIKVTFVTKMANRKA